jgi:hypothetical protein
LDDASTRSVETDWVKPNLADDDLLESSRQAWERLKEGGKKTWNDCMELGVGVQRVITKKLNETGLNTPNGREWAKHFSPVFQANPWLVEIAPPIRSRLMECMENRERIDAWLNGLDEKERIRLNHPTNVLAKWKKEFGLVEHKEPKKSAAEKQQDANLILQNHLDRIYHKLEVETFDAAKTQLDRLIDEGVMVTVAAEPELAKEITRLKGELDTATRGISSTTGELEKTKAQREKQATTLTRAFDLLKAVAASTDSFDPELVEQAGAFVAEVFPETVIVTDQPEPVEVKSQLRAAEGPNEVRELIDEIKAQQNARKESRATTDADLAERIVVWLRDNPTRDDGTPILIQSYLRGHGVAATLTKIKEIIRQIEPKKRGRKPGWRKQAAAAVE